MQARLTCYLVGAALFSVVLASRPALSSESSSLRANQDVGHSLYLPHCAACHGVRGDGGGAASVWLFPRPRNISAVLFKIKSTPGMALPTDQDLFDTVTRGMPGSSMPSFTYLTEQERREAVQYIKSLTRFT